MGVDFSHSEAHWSYGGFNQFRLALAEAIGIDLENMEGYGGRQDSWDCVNDDIKDLLDHSDCDGELTVDQCKVIAPRLRAIVDSWDDDYRKKNALELAAGMEEAVELNENLLFT